MRQAAIDFYIFLGKVISVIMHFLISLSNADRGGKKLEARHAENKRVRTSACNESRPACS